MRFKPSEALRFLGAIAAAVIVLGLIVLRVTSGGPTPAGKPHLAATQPPPAPAPVPAMPRTAATAPCDQGPGAAALANAASLTTLAWAPFRRSELGWETYVPLLSRELATGCSPDTPGFAAALAAWQASQRLPADGIMSAAVFGHLEDRIELRRPFVQVSAQGICPAPPAEGALAAATQAEGYSGKPIQLRAGALAAYRRMAAAARAADPRIAADPRNLTIFSGYRAPEADTARCVSEGNCDGGVRATCSAHRTGLALDLYVGEAPGFRPDSSADPNRLFMSRTPTYLWLVANADRFGFLPYPFEPWHWEWAGEAP